MEDLLQKIDQLIEVLNNNSSPLWLTIIGVFVPILLSLAVFLQTAIQHRNNKKIQKSIHDREIKVQMHNDFLKIYDDYFGAYQLIAIENQVDEILCDPSITDQWHHDFSRAMQKVCHATNRARLLIPGTDKTFYPILDKAYQKLKTTQKLITAYIQTEAVNRHREQTWGKITTQYSHIKNGDYSALNKDKNAYKDFVKLFSNDTTKLIIAKIKEIHPLFEYDKFDKYFEKYLQIDVE